MPLSDIAIRKTKPRAKEFKLTDGAGLYLLVKPNGGKLWRFAYRFAGKQKSFALGIYPTVTLADARTSRDAARKCLASGMDPSIKRKLDKHSTTLTFRLVAEDLLVKMEREQRAPRTLTKTRWLLEFAHKGFGKRPVGQITALEILAVLRKIEAREHYETARRVRSTCGMVFRYAIATGRAERDPSADLRGALIIPKVKHRAAIINPAEIGGLLRAIDGHIGQAATRLALKFAALVMVRPGELRQAEWKDFDFENNEWRIPAHVMKMRQPHRVPLARQTLQLLAELRTHTGRSRWLFPSVRSFMRPMSDNTLNAALRRLGYSSDEMCAHGFRTMASTRLNESGRWRADVIERQLAHQEENSVRRAYMHGAEFWPERVAMMQEWADYLEELRSGAKILALKRSVV